jgi:hypothetical protein
MNNMAAIEVNDALKQLGSRFEQLISLCELMRSENESLRNNKQHNEMLISEQAKVVGELTEKNQQMLIGGALVQTSENKNEAKEKIDKIVQEIDKCIALFSKNHF